jgi:hypothetical protein
MTQKPLRRRPIFSGKGKIICGCDELNYRGNISTLAAKNEAYQSA